MRSYKARDDAPQFLELEHDDWERDASDLLTPCVDAIDSIDSHGVEWRGVDIYVNAVDGEQVRNALSERLDWAVVEMRGDVISIHAEASDRNEAVAHVADILRAIKPYSERVESWAWDLEFDAEKGRKR